MKVERVARQVVLQQVRRRRLRLGTGRAVVPTEARLRWAPNWKSQLLGDLDAQTRGLVDVGANCGQTLLDFMAAGGQRHYVGFEPLPEAAAHVHDLIVLNGLTDSTVLPAALGAGHEVVPIHVPIGDSTSATLRSDLRPGRLSMRRTISVHVFDDIWAAVDPGVSNPVVKIDVEGAELEVLIGMRRFLLEARPTILCEVLDADASADLVAHDARLSALEDLLAEVRYKVSRVDKSTGGMTGQTACDRFPRREWRPATAEECDYLLHPA